MVRRDSDLPTCYVGVSFYRTTDGEELHTAVAQVFNERGDGGGRVRVRRPGPVHTDVQPPSTTRVCPVM